jgi:hypothetical protein
MKDHDNCRRTAATNGARFTRLLRSGYNKRRWIRAERGGARRLLPASIVLRGCNNPVDGFSWVRDDVLRERRTVLSSV